MARLSTTTRPDVPSTSWVSTIHVLRSSHSDVATIVGAGVTLFEAFEAGDRLEQESLPVRVIDAYSVAPIDRHTLRESAGDTGRLVVVEDHSVSGGLGDAVREAVGDMPGATVHRLAVREIPGSATPEQQRRIAEIDAEAIAAVVRGLTAGAS